MNGNRQIVLLQSLVDSQDKKTLLFCVPESAGDIFLSTSLLPSIQDIYKDFDIYFACKSEYKDILKNNPHIHKVLDYQPIMENVMVMEGFSEWKGVFDICMIPTVLTQRYINYHHNGLDKKDIELY